MEYNQLLLLQYLIATFEGQEEFYDLLNEADRLILEHVNGPQGKLPPIDITNLLDDDPELNAKLEAATSKPVNLPDKLALLAAMEVGPACKGCMTPGVTKDINGNCEICGYPGVI